MKRRFLFLFTFLYIVSTFSQNIHNENNAQSIPSSENNQSRLVSFGKNGKLEYFPYTSKGDIIPDFSHCGYMGGGVAIPDVKVVATISPSTDRDRDDAMTIQSVIDSVARLKLMSNGFRGTILLKKGVYNISSSLRITASGIVLRGEGNDKENGTVLLATTSKRYNVIELGIDAKHTPIKSSECEVTDIYVPSGSKIIHVKDAKNFFKAGDNVIVHRPSTSEWIHAVGMDSIPLRPLSGETTYDSFLRYRKYGNATNMNGTKQWTEGSRDLLFERTIVSVNGNEIVLDIPLTNALQKEFGGAKIYKYEFPERITNCGVENIYGMSIYDESVQENNKYIGEYYADENHANNFVFCKAVENAWIRDVSVEQFDCCVWTSPNAKYITGQDLSAVNPVSVITGGRRYAYSVWGQMCLFQRCYSSHHRHEFVLGASVPGPNAFVEGHGDMTFASSEPHQRWAAGCLYDNITIKGPDGSLLAVDRGWYGSGHGWAGAQIVFWNCSAPVIMVMQPPTAQNFAIGSIGEINDEWSENSRNNTIRAINGVSRSKFEYEGVQSVGNGWIESADKQVAPYSLYYHQLKDRLGEEALINVMSKTQIDNYIK